MSATIAAPVISNGTVTLSGHTGITGELPVTVSIGQVFGTTVDTDATGAWTVAYPLTQLVPGDYTVTAIPSLPPGATASATLTIAYPPGLTLTGAPVVIGTSFVPGTPVISGSSVAFPFSGTWSAATGALLAFSVDGVGKSSGRYGPTGAGNIFYCALNGLAAGAHAAEITTGTPVAALVTWSFVYEPTTAAPPSTGGSAPPVPDTLITRPAGFVAPTAAGQLGAVMQRANSVDTAASITTCGLTFKQGAVPAGSGVTLGGVPAQIDVHTTWPDKSARIASLTANAPALAAGASVFPMLAIGAPMTGPPPALALPAGRYPTSLEIGGVTYSYDIATLLKGITPDWLNGPLAVQGRIVQPITGWLRLVIDVTVYADGNANIVVEYNGDLAFNPTSPAASFTELGEILETKTVYGWQSLLLQSTLLTNAWSIVSQVSGLTQYQYTVWHVETDSRAAVPEMLFDVAAHIASGLMPRFDLSGVSNNTIAGYYASMTPTNGFGTPSTPAATVPGGYYPNPVPTLGWDGHTLYMGQTGGRGDIGQATDASCAWAITYDPRMRAYALAQAEGAASIPWHLFVQSTGRYINNVDQPGLWTAIGQIQGSGEKAQSLPADQQVYGGPWQPDAAHMPDACVIPYLLTGRRHYLDEVIAQASWAVMQVNARGLETGDLVDDQGQGRGMAWEFRQLVYASLLAADTDPLLPWLQQAVADNIAALLAIDTAAQGELAMYWCYPNGQVGANGAVPGTDIIAPWQNDFQQLAMVTAADCGVPGAAEALSKAAGFTAGRFLPNPGWNPMDGFDYYFTIYAAGASLTTWAALQVVQIANGGSVNGNNASLPPNCSLQYVAYALQTLTQMQRVLAAAGYTAAAAQCAQALAFVTQQANAFGAGQAFRQANPSFAIVGVAA